MVQITKCCFPCRWRVNGFVTVSVSHSALYGTTHTLLQVYADLDLYKFASNVLNTKFLAQANDLHFQTH